MARALNRMTVRQIAALKLPGRHADGGGLYLRITNGGARSWVFMAAIAGKRAEIGLGSVSAVSLASARRLANEMREAVAAGTDPRRHVTKDVCQDEIKPPTFGAFADSFIASVEAGWKNSVHRQQWRNSLRDHASLIHDKTLVEITTEDMLEILRPIWLTKPETAKRVRGRIERILDAAKAHGLRPREAMNPAAFRGHLSLLLPSQSQTIKRHHPALSWSDAPQFIADLRDRKAIAARCLEFVILTAARSGEALTSTWSEINLQTMLWTIPAERMKAGAEHVVPLSNSAINLLLAIKPDNVEPNAPIFGVGGAARSNMAMAMLLRRMGHKHITTHGFRSTFRDWAGDTTDFPREIVEQALAHTIQNKAERAYRRGTAVERRRALMQSWDDFLGSKTVALNNVEVS
ncbi:phage integrase central domain-containing protein [Sandarakinorhabdus sp.]|uniref:tyrosine-type recombinase/integrase n=1 Tax=Sandarakinorhabdus sp. TaxID=1916663 RepID=UPI00286E1202|nr:integrase arm-type DNA-binding domain-containing protein [Sandarakinorhabdus sp.]